LFHVGVAAIRNSAALAAAPASNCGATPMSKHDLNPGDRVRVSEQSRAHNCQPGEKGTVLSGPHDCLGGGQRYEVTMDNEEPSAPPVTFLPYEIEADV
jgi:hypothetical protein